MDEGEAILLGIPANDVRVDETCPYTAKLGGVPAWYDASKAIPKADLVCPQCCNQLYLVAQVYAPVTTPRTLYIFGCNSAKCVHVPQSWRVFRFQVDDNDQPKPTVAVETSSRPPVASIGWGRDDSISDDDDDDDGWGSVPGSTWGSTPSATTSDIDLEALLNDRDNAIQCSSRSSPQPPPAPTTKPDISAIVSKNTSIEDESSSHFASIFLHVDDEPAVSGTERFQHETQLLNAYLANEEKENASEVARLRTILKAKPSSSDGHNDTTSGGDHAEAYERTPLRDKLFLRFQKRLKRSPSQCLRYNYGGDPLWPSPPPAKLDVPTCACGDARVFEMQLMPATNYFLKVENYVEATTTATPVDTLADTTTTTTRRHPSSKTILDGGMDWQTVAIWSCPSSCAASHEEFAYVMPPIVD